eukprot:926990-Amphidinium_carterae.1
MSNGSSENTTIPNAPTLHTTPSPCTCDGFEIHRVPRMSIGSSDVIDTTGMTSQEANTAHHTTTTTTTTTITTTTTTTTAMQVISFNALSINDCDSRKQDTLPQQMSHAQPDDKQYVGIIPLRTDDIPQHLTRGHAGRHLFRARNEATLAGAGLPSTQRIPCHPHSEEAWNRRTGNTCAVVSRKASDERIPHSRW